MVGGIGTAGMPMATHVLLLLLNNDIDCKVEISLWSIITSAFGKHAHLKLWTNTNS